MMRAATMSSTHPPRSCLRLFTLSVYGSSTESPPAVLHIRKLIHWRLLQLVAEPANCEHTGLVKKKLLAAIVLAVAATSSSIAPASAVTLQPVDGATTQGWCQVAPWLPMCPRMWW